MFKLTKVKFKKDTLGLPVAKKQTSKVKPPDKYSAVLKSLIVISVMIQSQVALAFNSGPVASVQDEEIVACYARYSKLAYNFDKKFKSIPDCDRRFSPNEQTPFLYHETLDVPSHEFTIWEAGNNVDLYSRTTVEESGVTKKQALIVFRGTASGWDAFDDLLTEGFPKEPLYQPKYYEQTGIFGNKTGVDGGVYNEAAIPYGFFQRAYHHEQQIVDFLAGFETWRDQSENHELEIIITGHSLGASSSTVTGLWLMDRYESQHQNQDKKITKVEVFAFNSPNTGNSVTRAMVKEVLETYPDRYRFHLILNSVDLVSRIPGAVRNDLPWATSYYQVIDPLRPLIQPNGDNAGLAYTAVTYGKAAVNTNDGQPMFDAMESLYTNGCWGAFPAWNWGCARPSSVNGHSLEQWFTNTWTDYSIPTYRRHLNPYTAGNELQDNDLKEISETNTSLFNDNQPALAAKEFVLDMSYRFQRSDLLDRCLSVRDPSMIYQVGNSYCAIKGPRNFLFKAVQHGTRGMVGLQTSRPIWGEQYGCLQMDGALRLQPCHPMKSSQGFEMIYDTRDDNNRELGAYTIKSANGWCISKRGLQTECPSDGEMGAWIITEAPEIPRFPESVQLATEFQRDVSCVYNSSGSLQLNPAHSWITRPFMPDRRNSCRDRHLSLDGNTFEKEEFRITEAQRPGEYYITSLFDGTIFRPQSFEEGSRYRNDTDDLSLQPHYVARWFDGSYQFQTTQSDEDTLRELGLRLPNDSSSPDGNYGVAGKVGYTQYIPSDMPDWDKFKPSQIYLRYVNDLDAHHVDTCVDNGHDPSHGYDPSDNGTDCAVVRRTDAVDDPNAARVNQGHIVDIDVLRNDSHVHGGPLEITDVSVSRGAASINEDGTIRFKAPYLYFGPVSISYSISDGLPEMSDMPHGSDSAVATVHVVRNVALLKPASQTSTAYGGIASRAVDGDTNGDWSNGSVTHTTELPNAFWTVDLKGSHEVREIKLFNRTDGWSDRLSDFKIILERAGGSSEVINSNVGHQDVFTFPTNVSNVVRVTVQLNGQNHLSLAEVQVFGWETKSASVKLQNQQSVLHKGTRGSQGNSELACPAGYAITGYTGYGQHLMSSVKFRCHKIGTDGKWGAETWTGEWGGNNSGGGNTNRYSEMCSQDKYVTNIITKSSKAWVIDTEFECGRISLDIENKNRSYRYNPENKHVDMTGSPNHRYTDNTSGSACENNNVNQNGKYARVFTKANVGRKWRGNASAHVVNEIKYYCDQVKLQ